MDKSAAGGAFEVQMIRAGVAADVLIFAMAALRVGDFPYYPRLAKRGYDSVYRAFALAVLGKRRENLL